ncbi:MAG: NAD(P)H-hydrate dehydratase [Lachnospiraceae bacterium]|nr:NAD(P)H-hydrate dehydratase [Lachnospiraceae bacterium]
MEYLVTAKQMQYCDRMTSEYFKIPSAVLMERAALACTDVILKRQEQMQAMVPEQAFHKKTLIVAGCGNNGGDGLAIGRLLMQEGYPVDFWLIGDRNRMTELTQQQFLSVQAYGGRILDSKPQGEYDIIIDALFGVGLSRCVEGIYLEAVSYINNSDAFVLAVDIPSGIHADSGEVMGAAVFADVTVTFGFRKLGTFLYPGARYCGRMQVCSIGITQDSFLGEMPRIFTYTEPVRALMPYRDENGNKATFGKVCLIAGSHGMAGAALLAAQAVFAAGAGMLRIVTPAGNRVIMQETLPEAMLSCYDEVDVCEVVHKACLWADVIAIGPGLSMDRNAKQLLTYCIEKTNKPLVIDADALNLLAADEELMEKLCLKQADEKTAAKLILTPHPGEMARLRNCSVSEINASPMEHCQTLAQKLNASVLCKNARTMISAEDGRIYVNGSGNSGMATAGSGDVLTGILAGLLAQGMDSFSASSVGVYLHGLAGDKAAHMLSAYSMKAGDIIKMTASILAGQN